MSEVTLTQSTRVNLLTTQRITALADRTTNRLETAKRVNWPTDNIGPFFLAQSLINGASDLLAVKDTVSQGLRTLGNALSGLNAINDLIKQIRATALGATDQPPATRAEQAVRFDQLRAQLDSLAADVSYDGVRLVAATPDELTVPFSAATGSSLTISGVASDSASLGIGAAVAFNNFATDADIQAAIDALDAAITTLRTTATGLGNNAGILNTRLDFTQDLANSLETGAAKLTGADFNGEAANLLSLNIARQLSVASLNIANQSQQSILQLF